MADLIVASGFQGDALVFEYDSVSRICFAIRVDDPNNVLPELRIVKQGITSDPTTGTIRYALPVNRRFSIDVEADWPKINSFGSRYKALT